MDNFIKHNSYVGITSTTYFIDPSNCKFIRAIFQFQSVYEVCPFIVKEKALEYIPEDGVQQKFNSCIAITCLFLGFIDFELDKPVMGYIFTIMVVAASGIAILGFCIGCFIFFQLNQFRYKLKKATH